MTRRLLTAALLLAPALAAAADPNKAVVLERVALSDPILGKSPACTILKPKGWKASGQVNWEPGTIHQAHVDLTVSDPDSLAQFKTTPVPYFGSDSGNGLGKKRFDPYYSGLYCDPLTPVELHAAVLEAFPDAAPKGTKVVKQTDLPDVAKVFAKQTGLTVHAGRTRLTYKVDGVAVEEDFYLVLGYTATRLPTGGTFYQFWPLGQPFSLRAEKGKLDDATPLLMAVAYSYQPTEALGLAKAKGLATLMGQFYDQIAALDRLSKSISANNDAMLDMIRTGREARWAAEDRAAQKFSDYIRGVDRYTDGKSSYTVPYGYSGVWSDGSGTVILSNDRGYDPNRSERGTWSELKPVK
jgi:hypothetical protein